jgi:predicted NAD/FAD-binding protein
VRIAIIGAGVSGLACAHSLKDDHDLVIFEAADYPGGHANTVEVATPHGPVPVDTGFIVYNDRNYPHFERLLRELNVPTQRAEMSFGVSDGQGFEYNGASPNGLFAQRSNIARPAFHRMVADLLRFNRDSLELLDSDRDPSLREWLEEAGYSRWFIERLIVPQASAVWSADPRLMWSFPARFLIEFFDNHGMFAIRGRPQWRTITGGSRVYVEAIVRRLGVALRLATPVRSVRRLDDHVIVKTPGRSEHFDAVVFAVHSDQALGLLADPSDTERELLGSIPYQRNEAVLHTDRSLMPRRRRAWASWNYHLDPGHDGAPTVTYHMNRLQSLRVDFDVMVTLNRSEAIDPDQIIKTIEYAHPVYTSAGVAAQERVAQISGVRRTHYCGAYWGWGFHEDGVASALRVVDEIRAQRRLAVAA